MRAILYIAIMLSGVAANVAAAPVLEIPPPPPSASWYMVSSASVDVEPVTSAEWRMSWAADPLACESFEQEQGHDGSNCWMNLTQSRVPWPRFLTTIPATGGANVYVALLLVPIGDWSMSAWVSVRYLREPLRAGAEPIPSEWSRPVPVTFGDRPFSR